jgi:hypothetical protein
MTGMRSMKSKLPMPTPKATLKTTMTSARTNVVPIPPTFLPIITALLCGDPRSRILASGRPERSEPGFTLRAAIRQRTGLLALDELCPDFYLGVTGLQQKSVDNE